MRSLFFSVLLGLCASTAQARDFVVGYNEAWFGPNYSTGLTSNFDIKYVNRIFEDMKSQGGSVVRIWLFENRQGINLNRYAPQSQSIDPKMLTNISDVLKSARVRGLKVYLTLFDGNNMPRGGGELRDYYYNLLNNKYGENTAFLNNVMVPLLTSLKPHADVIYGLDFMNEIQAPMFNMFWGFTADNWAGPRRWMKETRDFVKGQAPWLRVTTSSGWSWGAKDLKNGLFSGLGFDFYDFHVYDNNGTIPYLYDICALSRKEGIPVILGEFGQGSKRNDDALQRSSTEKFLNNAYHSCLEGALAWRFDAQESYFSFQRADGTMRPAADVMRNFQQSL